MPRRKRSARRNEGHAMTITLDWLGCATFRLSVDGLVIWLDTFVDRPESAPSVGLTSEEITEADFALIGHSHWDHLAGADVVALRTGATVIGSHESARVLRERGVPDEQIWTAQGGEHFQLSEHVSVRVYPSLHSCIWSRAARPGTVVTGDYGVFEQERESRLAGRRARRNADADDSGREARQRAASSNSTGGALDYLIDTPEGTVLFQDSMGYWSGIYGGIRADVAVLAAAGRGSVDGEPFQGSVEQFVVRECELLRPRQVVLSHHDNFGGAPDVPDVTDLAPVHEELARILPRVEVLAMGLGEGVTLLACTTAQRGGAAGTRSASRASAPSRAPPRMLASSGQRRCTTMSTATTTSTPATTSKA
ncbi:MAG: MBL fold metallo-hydrolase [Dehalococcoidia bacterium]|nr:MBL fold metallo-hydrolase [Dehalococcoidia bacterium]